MSRRLAELGAGTRNGGMSVLDGMPHSATVAAVESVTLVLLTSASPQQLIDESPGPGVKVLWKFVQLLSQCLRQTSDLPVDALPS